MQCYNIIIGANGLVGRAIAKNLSHKSIDWLGSCHKRPENNLLKLDITDSYEVKAFFEKYPPEVIFDCANLAGGVDFCEKNPQVAADFYLNATKNIVECCRQVGAMLIFISTDYVFDGSKGPYKEDDPKNPLNVYGKLKLQAEEWIQRNLDRYLIVRTTNVYGWDPKTVTPNYIMGLYRTISSQKEFNAPSFLWGNPTYVDDLAGGIIELWMKKATGVFHIVGSSVINRYNWAKRACEVLELDCNLIKEMKEPPANMAPRPLKSWLDTSKFTKSYRTVLHDVGTGLELLKQDMERVDKNR